MLLVASLICAEGTEFCLETFELIGFVGVFFC